VGGILVITYLVFMTEPELTAFYRMPDAWLTLEVKYAVLGVFLLLLLADLRGYRRQHARQRADLQRLREEVDALWEGKKRCSSRRTPIPATPTSSSSSSATSCWSTSSTTRSSCTSRASPPRCATTA
jgi:hypothetical protein